MKKFLIILTFLFISIFSYSADIDFNIRVMMGLTKIEEKDNPKYKKFLDYIDGNLTKKYIVDNNQFWYINNSTNEKVIEISVLEVI